MSIFEAVLAELAEPDDYLVYLVLGGDSVQGRGPVLGAVVVDFVVEGADQECKLAFLHGDELVAHLLHLVLHLDDLLQLRCHLLLVLLHAGHSLNYSKTT